MSMFAFNLMTKTKLCVGDSIFDDDGEHIGKILHKYPVFKDRYKEFEYNDDYSYDVSSTKEIFERLEKSSTPLYKIDDYKIFPCSTHYIKKEH